MNHMNPFSTDQWIQQYPDISMATQSGGGESSDDTTTIPVINDTGSSQRTTTTGQAAGPKPIRRRSRASRRTPTTILNASPTDFRALVQRFTGCDTKNNVGSGSVSVSVSGSGSGSGAVMNLPRGPVNIDFGRPDNMIESSSPRYPYFHNQVTSLEHMQSAGVLTDFQGEYGIENANSIDYDSIDGSSFTPTQRNDIGSHGYNG